MNIQQVQQYCQSFAGAEFDNKGEPNNILSYFLPNTGPNKKFAYFKTSQPEQWRFSIRVTPAHFVELTDQAGIKPARYMHRFHWISIVDVSHIDDHYLKELISGSYHKAFNSLSKRAQVSINNQ